MSLKERAGGYMVEKKKIDRICVCCKNSLWNTSLYKLLDICKVCGLGVAKEMPSEKELVEHYQKDYFFGEEYVDYTKDRQALQKNFKKRIDFLKKFFTDKPTVCEIGSAYGYFLSAIKPYAKSTIGFEPSEDGVKYSNEKFDVNVSSDDYRKTKIQDKKDLIVMWDVIEHLRFPEKYVEKISQDLKKKGVISLTTGDIGAFIARRQRDKWRMIHPPTHLYYFTRQSLEILLERHGLKVVDVRYPVHYRNLGSVIGMLILDSERKQKSTYIFRLAEQIANFTKISRINFGINTRDLIMVTAVKEG